MSTNTVKMYTRRRGTPDEEQTELLTVDEYTGEWDPHFCNHDPNHSHEDACDLRSYIYNVRNDREDLYD